MLTFTVPLRHQGRRGRSRPPTERDEGGRRECQWQRKQLTKAIRALVLNDETLRNHACWFAFNC